MADYHPLIARAVAGLGENTAEARRSLYERARAALVAQLRGTTPPLSESDITRERLALEEAIRKVEAEQARRGRLERAPLVISPPEPVDEPTPSPNFPKTAASAAASMEPGASSEASSPAPTPQERPRPQEMASAEARGSATPKASPSAGPAPGARLGGPEDQLPESHDLSYEAPDEPQTEGPVASASEPAGLDRALRKLRARFLSSKGDEVPPWPRVAPSEPANGGSDAHELDEVEQGSDRPHARRELVDSPSSADAGRKKSDTAEDFPEPHEDRLLEDHPPRRQLLSGAVVKFVIAAIVIAVLGALAVVGYREGGNLVALFQAFRGSPPTVTREETTTPPKIEDRVGSAQPSQLPGTEQPGAAPSVQTPAVAQRVVLYEEDPSDPAGKRYVGSAIWRTETVSPGPGLAPELAVKADIEIPDRRITMMFSMVRNTDPKLPASHTIDIRFNLPPDFPSGGIANVPGILMKQAEQTRGVPLAGIAVKVTDNVFLIGLSSVESDIERNTQLLKERTWFDIPIVYANGSRAIIAMEKGTPGERAFNDAFTVWGRTGSAAR
jgi:hypothetical protein